MRFGLATGLVGMGPKTLHKVVMAAEASGMDTISVGEAGRDSFAMAAAVAGITDRVRVLSGVATWARPPVLTATSAATVDLLSGGRYELGLGTMPKAWNTDHYGIDPTRPLERMRDYVAVVRGAWQAHSGRRFSHDGSHFAIRDYGRLDPPVREDLPVHLAATRPGMARLAGQIADGVLFNAVHTVDWLRDRLVPAVRASGRDVEVGVMMRCIIDEDPTAQRAHLGRSFALYLQVPYFYEIAGSAGGDLSRARTLANAGRLDDAQEALPTVALQQMTLCGSAAAVREQASEYDGLVDWMLLTPPGGLGDAGLVDHSKRIIDTFGHLGPDK